MAESPGPTLRAFFKELVLILRLPPEQRAGFQDIFTLSHLPPQYSRLLPTPEEVDELSDTRLKENLILLILIAFNSRGTA